MKIDKPEMLFLFIPIVIVMFVLLLINFVHFDQEDKKSIWKYRAFLFFTRLIIFALLVFALTSPYIIKKDMSDGNP